MFEIIIAIVPLIIFYWVIDWELKYYRQLQPYIRYRSLRDPLRRSVYVRMLLMAVLAVLVALPFIILTVFGSLS